MGRLTRKLLKTNENNFVCECGRVIDPPGLKREGDQEFRLCVCQKLWHFKWGADLISVEYWIRPFKPVQPNGFELNIQTPEAAAEFNQKRDSGLFGPRNEAEYQESLRIAAELERERGD